ncbi:MAG: metallophosphoesterase family protein, partial [Vulcanimicrobiaceae bacterium]
MRKIWLLGAVVVAGFSLVAGFPGRYPAAEAIGPAVGDPVIAAAGDIACNESPGANQRAGDADDYSPDGCQMTRTAAVFKARRLAAILPLGDEQYPNGSAGAFESSYAKTWGTDRAPVHPVPGNHEYGTPHAAGYYGYFKAAAGDPAKGYYSWSLGSWHFIAINANCGEVGSCRAGSAEERWLKADLAAHPAACTVAYWHQPRFSSG